MIPSAKHTNIKPRVLIARPTFDLRLSKALYKDAMAPIGLLLAHDHCYN